ncbi:hypothetical protein NM208_g568 [Fusarium decemcellulare]|uniref:Uncharacterized protein n=2 Tax=Fusarium decemcellulare TaxID=57161 RepID=A0ACC1SYQ4_9HYPO|nr:hypothetical protein NM208_g745 [Fusarium decemcellulare]KAJ3549317.1 hypothetical protein NM208_g568 [Fusarium decemcellulare]
MVTVAIAGGTGGLGRAVVEEMKKSHHKTVVFGRQVGLPRDFETSPDLETELGVPVLAIDYGDPAAISRVIDDHQVHTIISVMTVPGQTSSNSQINLIRGAALSRTCKRFAPSEFGVVYEESYVVPPSRLVDNLSMTQDADFWTAPSQDGDIVLAKYKVEAVNELEKTDLEYTLFTTGYFMDYYGMPHVETHLKPIFMMVDIANRAAAIPGGGNTTVTFTYTRDIARCVVGMIDVDKWEKRSFIVGDRISINEVLAIAERVRGPFTVHHDSLEKLQQGRVTELPRFRSDYAFLPLEQKHKFFALFGTMFDDGTFDLKGEGASVNKILPHIRMTTVRDMIEQNWAEFQQRFQRLESLIQTLHHRESISSSSSPATSQTERPQADTGRPATVEADHSMIYVAGPAEPVLFSGELRGPPEAEFPTVAVPPRNETREQSATTVGSDLDKEDSLIEGILWQCNKRKAWQYQREDDESISGTFLGEVNTPYSEIWVILVVSNSMWLHSQQYFRPESRLTKVSILPVLRQSAITEMLDKYYSDPESVDCSCYALLSVVLASGCRACLSRGSPASFRESEKAAWVFFSNAISVEAKMMHQSTTLQSVQALILMVSKCYGYMNTMFTQGLGGSQPEMIYCTAAVRLAHSLGLHKAPLASWQLSLQEIQDRNCAFWSIYFLDKTLSMRSGHPSMMMDEDIECPFPTQTFERNGPGVAESDSQSFDYFLGLIQCASISSKTYRRFYTSTESRKPVTQMVKNAWAISCELQRWRDGMKELPPADKMADTFRLAQGLSGFELSKAALLRFFYWEGLISLHKACHANGLFSERLCQQLTTEEAQRLHEINSKGVEAARSMILLVQQIEVESHTPGWLVVYYPLKALITLFMHVINNPQASSVTENIAAMEMVTGFFARVDFLTAGQLQLTNCREFSAIARTVVENTKHEAAGGEILFV